MIRNLRAYSVFNNAGEETIEVKLETNESSYTASVPAGASKGTTEAVSFPVKKALKVFSDIRPNIITLDEKDWEVIDDFLISLDNTRNFSKIGGNVALAISIAVAKAATKGSLWKTGGDSIKAEFPYPAANVIGGGEHGGNTAIQEFLLIPHTAKNPAEAVRSVIDVWSTIGEELSGKNISGGRNRENAWISSMDDLETLRFLSDMADDFGMRLGLDVAATSFWNGKIYNYKEIKKKLSPAKQLEFMFRLVDDYKIYYLEDPFHEDDFESFSALTSQIDSKTLVVGDDLFTTHTDRLKKGIEKESANAMIVKPNQVGTLSQVNNVVRLADENSIVTVPSHRSGETEDDWIADLAVGFGSPLIKIGLADMPKFNRLSELWKEIGDVKMATLPL